MMVVLPQPDGAENMSAAPRGACSLVGMAIECSAFAP